MRSTAKNSKIETKTKTKRTNQPTNQQTKQPTKIFLLLFFTYLLCLQKSMKPARKPQNVIGARGRRRLVRPSAALINTTGTRKRVRRSQSVAKQIAT